MISQGGRSDKPDPVDFDQSDYGPAVEDNLGPKGSNTRRARLEQIRRRLKEEGSLISLRQMGDDLPLIAYSASPSDPGGQRLIHIVDLSDLPVPTMQSLREILGLTVAEARLAQRLARGKTLEEAAVSLNIKGNTARTPL